MYRWFSICIRAISQISQKFQIEIAKCGPDVTSIIQMTLSVFLQFNKCYDRKHFYTLFKSWFRDFPMFDRFMSIEWTLVLPIKIFDRIDTGFMIIGRWLYVFIFQSIKSIHSTARVEKSDRERIFRTPHSGGRYDFTASHAVIAGFVTLRRSSDARAYPRFHTSPQQHRAIRRTGLTLFGPAWESGNQCAHVLIVSLVIRIMTVF